MNALSPSCSSDISVDAHGEQQVLTQPVLNARMRGIPIHQTRSWRTPPGIDASKQIAVADANYQIIAANVNSG